MESTQKILAWAERLVCEMIITVTASVEYVPVQLDLLKKKKDKNHHGRLFFPPQYMFNPGIMCHLLFSFKPSFKNHSFFSSL